MAGYQILHVAGYQSGRRTAGKAMIALDQITDLAALAGRVFYSSVFLVLGTGKISAFGGTVDYMKSLGLRAPLLFTVAAIVVEIAGGLFILAGYQTRVVAFGLALYTFVSAFIGHFQLSDFNQWQHFWKNMGLVGGALAFGAFGAGPYSLDGAGL